MANPNPPNNLKNTEATQFKSGSNAAEMGRRGGIASGIAQRKKKTIAEQTMLALNAAMSGKHLKEAEATLGKLAEDENTVYIGMTAAMIRKALAGDVRAFTALTSAVEKSGGASGLIETEDDAFTKSLRERAESL